MAPYQQVVTEQLDLAFRKIREDAQSMVRTADEELEKSTFLLREKDLREISDLRSEIEGLMNTDSYFGYLDVQFVVAIPWSLSAAMPCRSKEKRVRRVLDRLERQVERDIVFVLDYSFPRTHFNSYYRTRGDQGPD